MSSGARARRRQIGIIRDVLRSAVRRGSSSTVSRTPPQAEALMSLLDGLHIRLDRVINFMVTKTIIRR